MDDTGGLRTPRGAEQPATRTAWIARPRASHLLRTIAVLVPLTASVAAGVLVGEALPRPDGLLEIATWLVLVLLATVATLLVVERIARRVLPLAMLLQLSLTFPDRAPSRLRVALRAGSARRLARCVGLVTGPKDALDAEAIVTLAAALNGHDRRTRGHSERVRALTELVGREMHLGPQKVERLRWAAFLHDIGKLSVPSRVLNKPGDLDRREWRLVREHPRLGEHYAEALRAWMGEWIHAIGHHHEHWDGSGYPAGLTGTEISLGGRIVAVTDAFETMTALRSYNKPMTAEAARAELTRCGGKHFDPRVVRAFLGISIGRLRWKIGIAAWLAQLPVLGVPMRAGAHAVTTAAGLEGSAGALATGMATVAAGIATPVTPVVAVLALDALSQETEVIYAVPTADARFEAPVAAAGAGLAGAVTEMAAPLGSAPLPDGDGGSGGQGRTGDPPPSSPGTLVEEPQLDGQHAGWTIGNHLGWSNGKGQKQGDPPHGFGG